jgi:PEP-CTERM motif
MRTMNIRTRSLIVAVGSTLTAAVPTWAGNVGFYPITGDADSGISTSKTYTHAVDLNRQEGDPQGNDDTLPLSINGVPFSGGAYTLTNLGNVFNNGYTPSIGGGLGDLLDDFNYGGGAPEIIKLTGLTPGQNYRTTFYYDSQWGPALSNFTPSDDGLVRNNLPRDRNQMSSSGNVPVVGMTYHFTAPASGEISYSFQDQGGGSFHQYGFTNETTAFRPIQNLHNTGVSTGPGFSGTNGALADDAADPHYTAVSANSFAGPMTPFTPLAAKAGGGAPIGPWLGDGATSAWITASTDGTAPSSDKFFAFTTTFDTPGVGANPFQILIEGSYGADNTIDAVLIDNVQVPGITGGSFAEWTPFSLSALVSGGSHTITWITDSSNLGDPTGLRVVYSFAGYVPEPSSLSLLGLAGLAIARRRRSRA